MPRYSSRSSHGRQLPPAVRFIRRTRSPNRIGS
jgi:hypothetical protein